MSKSLYEACKGLAYPLLSIKVACDHTKAKSLGYADGWEMLMDKHDDTEMAVFCVSLPQYLSPKQCNALLDGLAREYTEFANWSDFATACADYPSWQPSRETVAQHKERKNVTTY